MDRAEKIGLGVAAIGHIALFAILSARFLAPPAPPPPQVPMDVTLADKVGLEAKAPVAVEPPAESRAPEQGAPQDAPPPPPLPQVLKEPEPAPPQPQPKAVPPPKPAPKAMPQPKQEAAPPKPASAKTPPKHEAAAKPAPQPAKTPGKGTTSHARDARVLGADIGAILKGVNTQPAKSTSVAPKAAAMSSEALMDIGSKIKQQVQPCANRQVKPGLGAERIIVLIELHLAPDGSLTSDPVVVSADGVDDENSRYLTRVKDNAIATFKGCAPMRGLPAELYDVPRGWRTFKLRYKLPG